jgi:hypothetical protein
MKVIDYIKGLFRRKESSASSPNRPFTVEEAIDELANEYVEMALYLWNNPPPGRTVSVQRIPYRNVLQTVVDALRLKDKPDKAKEITDQVYSLIKKKLTDEGYVVIEDVFMDDYNGGLKIVRKTQEET